MSLIDLRSDTVTRPGPEMRRAMIEAEVGDDVFRDDPTVEGLEELAAGMLGKEEGLFVPSGTQSNLCALLTHCGRGDEYIVGQQAHTYIYEGGGGAALGGIQPQPLDLEEDGSLDLEKVKGLIKPDDYHYARTRLLCLENTTNGRVLPEGHAEEARALADHHGLSLHLDGARLFNAAVRSGRSESEIAAPFDSVSICLSKGLGAPVGSVLTGSSDFIREARRWRKVVGGGMRQSGLLAAAGIYVLQNNVGRLAEDHAHARLLAEGLAEIEGCEVDPGRVQTNMVYARILEDQLEGLAERLREEGVLVYPGNPIRLVTHLDISREDVDQAVEAFGRIL
ncbi:MAG: low-specificity L-threonine aldolase [Verrucomicrobiaceae bacterium]|nr:low-specificity L-threonine aldolase [Verrucomicrobiaceae bacterium]